jgi:uncharacterized membrane protein
MVNKIIMPKLKSAFQKPAALWVGLVAGLSVYVGLSLSTITQASVWFDEAFSAYIVRFNFVEILRYTAADVHPPLYYWALKLWQIPFGSSDLAMRSLSVLFGCVAIVFAFLLVKRLFGKKAALISLLFLIFLPILARYSQEARMYTMSVAIGFAATYVLVRALETKTRWRWRLYGILVAAGMLTHYFMALVWLAHLTWQFSNLWQQKLRGKQLLHELFSGPWWKAYILAIILYIPWLPFMLKQLTVIQVAGFWIGPVGVDSLTNVVTNFFLYLEHNQVKNWLAFLLILITTSLVIIGMKSYRLMGTKQKTSYRLIISLALVPVMLLFVSSLPPLRSSFVGRYVLLSFMSLALAAAVTITARYNQAKGFKWYKCALIVATVMIMIVGVKNVIYYGNYNKNSGVAVDTKQLVKKVQSQAKNGEPIIAESPWIYYEAVFYDTADNPVYFLNETIKYDFGSLEMLKNNEFRKIKNLNQFTSKHPIVWYIGQPGNRDLKALENDWQVLKIIRVNNRITGKPSYQAIKYQTNI